MKSLREGFSICQEKGSFIYSLKGVDVPIIPLGVLDKRTVFYNDEKEFNNHLVSFFLENSEVYDEHETMFIAAKLDEEVKERVTFYVLKNDPNLSEYNSVVTWHICQ